VSASGIAGPLQRSWLAKSSMSNAREKQHVECSRKAACRMLAEAGCSEPEIASISGHRTLSEVSRYTRAARQKKLAQSASARVIEAFPATETGTQ